MAVKLAQPLKQLLKASFLGGNKNHPLAGWRILTMLYHDGGSRDPLTLNYLLDRYNQDYLDANERPLRDEVLKKIMYVLSDQARLVDVAPRKIRLQMLNGGGSPSTVCGLSHHQQWD